MHALLESAYATEVLKGLVVVVPELVDEVVCRNLINRGCGRNALKSDHSLDFFEDFKFSDHLLAGDDSDCDQVVLVVGTLLEVVFVVVVY